MRCANRRGIVLLLTLAVIMILAVLVLEFNYVSRVDASIAYQLKDAVQAEYLVKSALQVACGMLTADDSPAADALDEDWAQVLPELSVAGGMVRVRIHDAESFLPINADDYGKRPARLQRLLATVGETGVTAAELLNAAPFETWEHLRRAAGAAGNYLTCSGSGLVNINTASRPVLACLSAHMTEAVVEAIIDFRDKHRIEHVLVLSPAYSYQKPAGISLELWEDIKDMVTVKSTVFHVEAMARVNQAEKRIRALIRREGKKSALLYVQEFTHEH